MVRMIVWSHARWLYCPLVQPHRTCGSATPNTSNFAEAYNRMDADAMAAAFLQMIGSSGIFQGRDAIRRNMHDVLGIGLHD